MEKEEKALIDEALKTYKIPKGYVFASGVDVETGKVVIVTHGGKKIRHRKGEPAKFELTYTEITGELPEQKLIWCEKLNQKIDLKTLFKKNKK